MLASYDLFVLSDVFHVLFARLKMHTLIGDAVIARSSVNKYGSTVGMPAR